ncbi:MAG: hypothetical protein WCC69_06805 [Pirellulales bacterium]
MHGRLLATRILRGLGAAVFMACAAECMCGLALRAWPEADRGDEVQQLLGLDAAVGYGPTIERSHAAASDGTGSRFFTLESFEPRAASRVPDSSTARDAASRPLRILALGGSTTDPVSSLKHAGRGGDWPHLLGQELAARGHSVEIANAGLVGCLAAQELTRLIAILPDHRFDIVISLTGINETYFADRAWYRDPDERMSPKFLLAAFEELADGGTLSAGGQTLVATGIVPWIRRRSPVRLVGRLRELAASKNGGPPSITVHDSAQWERLQTPAPPVADQSAALDRAAAAWLTHVKLMAVISRELGARYIAALQPAMGVGMSRNELVAALRESLDRGQPDAAIHALLSRPGYLERVDSLYRSMREGAAGQPWFVDLSGPKVIPASMAGFHSPRYPNAQGNHLIAVRLAKVVTDAQ